MVGMLVEENRPVQRLLHEPSPNAPTLPSSSSKRRQHCSSIPVCWLVTVEAPRPMPVSDFSYIVPMKAWRTTLCYELPANFW